MDCRTVKDYIEDYLDGMLDDANRKEFMEHAKACPDCRNRLAHERAFRHALRSMPAPAPDPHFATRAFARAAAAHNRRRRINTSIIMRMAASILVIFALGFMFRNTWWPSQPEWPKAFVRLNQPGEIRLVFYSKEDLGNIAFRLEPSEGVELVGFEDQREIVWQTNLVRGKNLLVLPVIARNREGGSLIAEIRHGSQNKQFGLRIKVLQPDSPGPSSGWFEGSVVSTNIL
jgi:hypothetical protein